MTVFIEDSFDAAHWLPNVPADHKCHALHGHTYRIRLEVAGEVDSQMGWVIDYAELKVQWNAVKRLVDHHCLNEIPALENSTCERLALWIAECLKPAAPGLCRIEIRETEKAGVVLEL
jgi:6-pyruvoyltetrahydropterin/6-carboxytetrahydropterin synthase